LPPGVSYDPAKKRYRVHGKHGGKTLATAKRKKREIERGLQSQASYTLTAYVPRWAAHQERRKKRSLPRNLRQLELHVLPTLGAKQLGDVTPSDVLDLCWSLYGPSFGAKSVENVKKVLSSVFTRAQFEQLVDSNPCKLIPRGELPKTGSNPWPKYEPEEVAALLTDERIPPDRRVLYALAFYFAVRIGEACGFRFSDWDRTQKPLGLMLIDKQYDGQPLKPERDDYKAERRFPVHPEAARLLAWWKLAGFAERFGRPPRDDDPVSPYPRNMKARTLSKASHGLYADEKLTGVEHKPGRLTHGFRKAFISMARAAGANPDVIRTMTHPGGSRDILDVYTQWPWTSFCDAVRLVKLPEAAQVISLEDRRA
jgi:integrase